MRRLFNKFGIRSRARANSRRISNLLRKHRRDDCFHRAKFRICAGAVAAPLGLPGALKTVGGFADFARREIKFEIPPLPMF